MNTRKSAVYQEKNQVDLITTPTTQHMQILEDIQVTNKIELTSGKCNT